MNFGNANEASLRLKKNGHSRNSNNFAEQDSGVAGITQRSRLTDDDLEEFRLSILEKHKKKHYRVLMVSAMLIICLGFIVAYFMN